MFALFLTVMQVQPVRCFSHVVVTEIARFSPLLSAAGLSAHFLPLSVTCQASSPGKRRGRGLCRSNLKDSCLSVTVNVRGQGGQRLGLLFRAPQRHCDWLVKRSLPVSVAWFKSEKSVLITSGYWLLSHSKPS